MLPILHNFAITQIIPRIAVHGNPPSSVGSVVVVTGSVVVIEIVDLFYYCFYVYLNISEFF